MDVIGSHSNRGDDGASLSSCIIATCSRNSKVTNNGNISGMWAIHFT